MAVRYPADINPTIRRRRRLRYALAILGILTLGVCTGSVTAYAFDVFDHGGHSIHDAIRALSDEESTENQRRGARFVIARDTVGAIQALRDDGGHESITLLNHIHRLTEPR